MDAPRPGALRALASSFTLDYGPALRRSVWLAVPAILLLVGLDALVTALQARSGFVEGMGEVAEGYGKSLVPVRFEKDTAGHWVAVADQEEAIDYRIEEGGESIAIVIDTNDQLSGPPVGPARGILIQSGSFTFWQPGQTRNGSTDDLVEILGFFGMKDLSRESLLQSRDEHAGTVAAVVWGTWFLGKVAVSRPLVLLAFSLLALAVSQGRGHGYGSLLRIGFYALIPLSALDLVATLVPIPWPPVPFCCLSTDDLLCWAAYGTLVGLAARNIPSASAPVASVIFEGPGS